MACPFGEAMKRPARIPAQLSESLHQRLNAYALAASAAGAGMLALAMPAEARIVYTKTHHAIIAGYPYEIDLNHDGTRDFVLSAKGNYSDYSVSRSLWIRGRGSNCVVGNSYGAKALYDGVRIAAKDDFIRKGFMARYRNSTRMTHYISTGPWANVNDRYLGLKFHVKGTVHYGWARMSVSFRYGGEGAILTGYAYETIPNKPIIAGKTHGRDEATLGRLAQGASNVSNGGKP
jgi:hypothetical protein